MLTLTLSLNASPTNPNNLHINALPITPEDITTLHVHTMHKPVLLCTASVP